MDWIEENGEKRQKQFYVKCNFFSRHFSFELFSFLVHFLAAYNEFYFLFSFLYWGQGLIFFTWPCIVVLWMSWKISFHVFWSERKSFIGYIILIFIERISKLFWEIWKLLIFEVLCNPMIQFYKYTFLEI